MEKLRSDQVVLFIDQENPKPPTMETEFKDQIAAEQKSQNPERTKTLRRLSFSKPKARLLELNYPATGQKPIPESDEIETFLENYSSSEDNDDEDEGDWEKEFDEEDGGGGEKVRKRSRKIKWRLLIEWVLFIIIMTCLICSLTIKSIKNELTWGLETWKWCLMVMVTFCGRLVSGWLMTFVVFLIVRNFMLREKVLYFVYGLRRSIQNCVWLALVLLAWSMFNGKVHKRNKILKKVFQALVAVLLGATIWLVKIVLVKLLASSFHVTTYFDRMKESVFHHYILDTLSRPPMDMDGLLSKEKQGHNLTESRSMPARLKEARNVYKSKKFGSRKIDMEKLRRLSMERRASAWSVKKLVNYIRSSGLSTISKTVDEFGNAESEITSEWAARNFAQRIFKNVAKPGAK